MELKATGAGILSLKYGCTIEGLEYGCLQFYLKGTQSQIFSCKTCGVLQSFSFIQDYLLTPGQLLSDFQQHFWRYCFRQIFRKKLDFAIFSESRSEISLGLSNELFSGYPSYPIQKWYIWASFQTSRKRFRKLQEAIWLTVINEIFIFYHISTPFVR